MPSSQHKMNQIIFLEVLFLTMLCLDFFLFFLPLLPFLSLLLFLSFFFPPYKYFAHILWLLMVCFMVIVCMRTCVSLCMYFLCLFFGSFCSVSLFHLILVVCFDSITIFRYLYSNEKYKS